MTSTQADAQLQPHRYRDGKPPNPNTAARSTSSNSTVTGFADQARRGTDVEAIIKGFFFTSPRRSNSALLVRRAERKRPGNYPGGMRDWTASDLPDFTDASQKIVTGANSGLGEVTHANSHASEPR